MPSRFVDTLRSLDDTRGGWPWLLPALLVLVAWLLWLFCARVHLYASTVHARLEVGRMVYHVMTSETGTVTRTRCELGLRVRQGEVLVELDDRVERAELTQMQAELSGLQLRSAALEAQIMAGQARRVARLKLDKIGTERASLELEQARSADAYRRELAAVNADLLDHSLVSRVEELSARVEAEKSQLHVRDSNKEVERFRATQHYQDTSELFQLSELRGLLAELNAAAISKEAEVVRVRAQLERRKLVAPTSGRLGHILPLRVGDVAKSAEILATVVPEEAVRVVAEFAPDEAAGRILPGQSARIRLSGFSWVEYGMIEAQVIHVASEPHQDSIRVELALAGAHGNRIPLQHGLPGQVDVRIQTTTPWAIVARSLGAILGKRGADSQVPLQLARRGGS
ncbi:MAG: hypothetical protein JWN04_2410 [Myxococcaceae bacterium]|nr:hypothetical protein [Myxococcaceae bacterium]